MAYSFQNEDGSIDFDKLNNPARDRLLAQEGRRLRPAVIDTLSGAIRQDSGWAGTSAKDAFHLALKLKPIKTGEAVGIRLESGDSLLLWYFHEDLRDTAINPDM